MSAPFLSKVDEAAMLQSRREFVKQITPPMPRKYTMTRRAHALQQTRARIVDATVAAHRELGIQATSWDEIARRADVGVGTVYRHFRSLAELLPACGEVVTATLALPPKDEIPPVFDGAHSPEERIERLVRTVFATYERGAPFIENIHQERKDLPDLDHWHTWIEDTLDTLTREALQPLKPSKRSLQVTRALIDLYTWKAFQRRGLSHTQTVATVRELITRALAKPGPSRHA
jgi:AcrR family transcriptional regulator